MKEYDQETLKRVQQAELRLLKDFVSLCEENNLTYFGVDGTAIGAVRHQGFIPWDDDIDIAMPRKDYERFLKIAPEKMSEKYRIVNARINENFPLMTTHIQRKGTVFVHEPMKNLDIPNGIFLDIFPFDNISDDPKKRKKQLIEAFVCSKLQILRSIPHPTLGVRGIKAKIIHAICIVAHGILAGLHIPKRVFARKCDQIAKRYDKQKTEYMTYLFDTTPTWHICKENEIFPLQQLPFEDMMLNFPNKVHDYLTRQYGDYMQLPPVEKRKNHYPYKLEFGDDD